MSELRDGAVELLVTGKVTIVRADLYAGGRSPSVVEAWVDAPDRHVVELRRGRGETRECRSRERCVQPCAHVAAVALVTGWAAS